MIVVACREVRFYTPNDETLFFEWIRLNKSVVKAHGIGDVLELHVKTPISDSGLRDLIAMFKRYRISMRQLAKFETARNRSWFRDPQTFWYKMVFGGSAATAEDLGARQSALRTRRPTKR